jgi:hypothetical protein
MCSDVCGGLRGIDRLWFVAKFLTVIVELKI